MHRSEGAPTPSRVLLIGATGLIGRAVAERLQSPDRARRYELVALSRSSAPRLDLEDHDSIGRCLEGLAPFQHVIVAAGEARFAPLAELDASVFELGLRSKLMGQVALTLAALRHLSPGGSITLTSGALAHTPIAGSAAVALVNGALESFVRAIALEVEDSRRVNIVSPGWIKETMRRLGMDPTPGAAARDVAELYAQAVEGPMHGQVIDASLAAARGRSEPWQGAERLPTTPSAPGRPIPPAPR